MFDIKTFVNFFSLRSASVLTAFLCIGFLLSCSGDVGSPEFNISGGTFRIRDCDVTVERTFETEFPVANHVRVNLEAINGEVAVTGQDNVDRILVTAQRSVCSDSQEDAELHIDDLEIRVTDSDHEIQIQTNQPKNSDGREYRVEYDIVVPSSFEVVTTQVNGRISILDIDNNVDVVNVNGDVILSGIYGEVTADVANGSIEATMVLPINKTIDLSTGNGSLELNIPTSTSAELSATVVNGEIRVSNLDITDRVETKQSLTGILGDGEGTIELSTSNGSIDVVGFD